MNEDELLGYSGLDDIYVHIKSISNSKNDNNDLQPQTNYDYVRS